MTSRDDSLDDSRAFYPSIATAALFSIYVLLADCVFAIESRLSAQKKIIQIIYHVSASCLQLSAIARRISAFFFY